MSTLHAEQPAVQLHAGLLPDPVSIARAALDGAARVAREMGEASAYFGAESRVRSPVSGVSQFLTLPLPPSINTYWRKSPRGMYITRAGVTFRKDVERIVAAMRGTRFGAHPLNVSIIWHMRDKRRSDTDNRIKPLIDALQHAGLYDDDVQIESVFAYRSREIIKGGVCHVLISGA